MRRRVLSLVRPRVGDVAPDGPGRPPSCPRPCELGATRRPRALIQQSIPVHFQDLQVIGIMFELLPGHFEDSTVID